MSNDTIKDIINDLRDLAAMRKNPMTRLALEGIANRLQALLGKHGEQENQEIAAPASPDLHAKKGLVGIISNERSILAWNYKDNLAIRVTGTKMGEDAWEINARRGDQLVFGGLSHGGKWQADTLVKFLRNGMVSRAMKVRKNHENRKARGEKVGSSEGGKETSQTSQTSQTSLSAVALAKADQTSQTQE